MNFYDQSEIITGTQKPSQEVITVFGAREHNLKNITLTIPRGKFVVITGVSGSGKSTLAFDILFSEGQRRFLDAMNAYSRQFVEQLARPEVDLITGLPPTVSIEQRNSRGGGKSTVATVTEVYHFLRLLFAKLGTQYCPDCSLPVEPQTRDALVRRVTKLARKDGVLQVLAPVIRNRKGFHTDVAEWAARHGYSQVRADGRMHSTGEPFRLDRFSEHDVEIVLGTFNHRSSSGGVGILDEALRLGHGVFYTLNARGLLSVHSTERACPGCGRSFEVLDPKMFSYNSAQGWCLKCRGFGELFYLPDVDRGARADAIEESWFEWQEGKREPCPECHGARLNPIPRAVRLHLGRKLFRPKPGVAEPTIDTFSRMSVAEASTYFRGVRLDGRDELIARDILPEIRERLKFLEEVGLGYLHLGRSVTTLSGGEAQRIRLAAQLGSNLSGVLYILDEPTIGLHSRDNEHLLHALNLLKNRGNSLIVVEHDEDTMRQADYIIDLGPGAGVHGGAVVAQGTLQELLANEHSITGQALNAVKRFPARGERRATKIRSSLRESASKEPSNAVLTLKGATSHNLKNLTVHFPLRRLVVVTGVSGSGKSTLLRECLIPALNAVIGKKKPKSAVLEGFEGIKSLYEVDQAPIGRTPRSTPATYIGFFNQIRELYAQSPESRLRGYSAGRFSFNSAQGRCPACEGAGRIKLEMNFLPPAYITCDHCHGTRYNPETLDIQFRGKSIADVLDLSVSEAIDFFQAITNVRRPLEALRDTGLDYLKLGQISPTLSGGEAQRIKLVSHLLTGLKEQGELFNPLQKHNLFILEEPTIGLHMTDVNRLVAVLQRLVDAGHSVIVIEHNLDLIAEADWVIDLGPEAGEGGGQIVAEGTPEQVARNKRSHTARFLNKTLRQ